MTVVADTNIWVSSLMGKRLEGLTELLRTKRVRLITSEEQLAEVEEVLSRPKVLRFLATEGETRALTNIRGMATIIRDYEPIVACRDPKDDYLLGMAVAANADLIVTGDKDLLTLHPFRGIAIITYAEFERRLNEL